MTSRKKKDVPGAPAVPLQDSALDIERMRMALREAARAAEDGEVPVGAIIVHGTSVIGRAFNQVERLHDPTAHAEMIAITQAASALGDWRLADTVLYVTKEPCPMCAGAIALARVARLVFGTPDPDRGAATSVFKILNHPAMKHRMEIVGGVLEEECRALLQGFFAARRRSAAHED